MARNICFTIPSEEYGKLHSCTKKANTSIPNYVKEVAQNPAIHTINLYSVQKQTTRLKEARKTITQIAFTNLTVWIRIRKVIDAIIFNAVAV